MEAEPEQLTNQILSELRDEYEERVQQKVEQRLDELETQNEQQDQEDVTVDVDLDEQVDEDQLAFFLKRPYLLEQLDDQTYQFAVPIFVDFQVGSLQGKTEDGRFKVFQLDPATKTLHGIPDTVRNDPRVDVDLNDDRFQVQGNYIYYDEQHRSQLENTEEFRRHLAEIGDTEAKIKHGHEFQLLEDLLDHGFDPFTPSPVDEEDIRTRDPDVGFDLRPYQRDWVDHILEHGDGCIVGPTGSGKSIPTLYLFSMLKGTKALICYGRMTVDQWKTYVDTWTDLNAVDLTDIDFDNPDLSDVDVIIGTYHSVDKLHTLVRNDVVDEFAAVATDESHRLAADTFAAAATLPTKYRWGMTATPYREDDRTYAIQAFTGPYVGMDWDRILELQDKERHDVYIHIVDDEDGKVRQARDVYNSQQKTLLFTDSLDMGETVAEAFNCEFVHGDTSNQYEAVTEALDRDGKCVVSRVGDHGLSVDGLEAIIEVDFLFGSRNQQLQRTGRLLHGYEGTEHHIIFTGEEWERHHKRVFSLLDRDFDIHLPEGVEIPDEYDESELSVSIGVDQEVQDGASDAGSSVEDMDAVEVLRHDAVKEELQDRLSDVSRSSEKIKQSAVLFAKRDDVTISEVARVVDYKTRYIKEGMSKLCNEPAIFEKVKDGGSIAGYRLNRDAASEIIEAQEKRQELEDELNELGL
ncbi:MAG: DEAD/DEAH box helicase family protein [Candidatus Nanohaloarchaea archaeon]|nr:DEAD/DEAH box helicase family protein [Candidatus Nanohaloarchaea archaeon]